MRIPPHNSASPRFDIFQALRRADVEATDTHADKTTRSATTQPDEPASSSAGNSVPGHGLLESYVNQHLRDSLDSSGVKATQPKPSGFEDFSPSAVAGRIVDFVGQRLAKVEDADKRAVLLDQARAGIEKGFADARDVLKGMGMLQGDVAENIDDTYGRVMAGLDKLGQPVTAATEGQSATTAVDRASAASLAQVESGSLSLSIQTADGDRVSLKLQREQGAAATAYAAQGRGGSASGASYIQYDSSALSFSVEGDLDEGERKAIAALIKDVEHLATKFFDGDVRAAFQEATKMGFDNQELAGFALDLTHTVETRAVAAYQATAAGDSATAASTASPSIAPAVNATADLNQLFQSTKQQGVFADPLKTLSDLFAGVSEAKGYTQQPQDDEVLRRVNQLLGQFAQSDYALLE